MKKKIKRISKDILSCIAPRLATKFYYYRVFNRHLNLKNPITFNEKIMWLKLYRYNNSNLVTTCVDKYEVREYVNKKYNNKILNTLYGAWDNVEEIDWGKLPQKFVIKLNHGAGFNLVSENKKALNIPLAKEKLNYWWDTEYWKNSAELNYKHVNKKIICERFLETPNGDFPIDYKIYCFNGEPTLILVTTERKQGYKRYFFDLNWNPLFYEKGNSYYENPPEKPSSFNDMIEISSKLAEPFPFVRVDLYEYNNAPLFGELTFTPAAGLANYYTKEASLKLGNMIDLKYNL